MSNSPDRPLLDALLDSWDRGNTILINLLRLLPLGGSDARATESSPTVAQMISHMAYVRLVLMQEDAPEFARDIPTREERAAERDPDRLARWLDDSARAVREAVRGRLENGRDMDRHYDHPILMLQHLVWHEGYHHGQIKLALKIAGIPLADEVAGPVTWGVWMRKGALAARVAGTAQGTVSASQLPSGNAS